MERWRLGEEPPHFQDEEIIDPNVNDSDSSENDGETSQTFNNEVDYKAQCHYLKKKLKFLIYVSIFIPTPNLITYSSPTGERVLSRIFANEPAETTQSVQR